MKKLFTLLAFMSIATFTFSQDIYFAEDFNAGLPAGWDQVGDGWIVGTSAAASSQFFVVPAADGNVVCFNDDALGNGANGGGTITTSEIDLSGVTGDAILEMNSYFPNLDYQGNDETAIIYASSDGVSFDPVVDIAGGEGGDFGVVVADISAYAGGSVWLRFEYEDGNTWNYGWAFDNVQISSEVTLIPEKSYRIHAGSAVMIDQALDGIEYYNKGFIQNAGSETIESFDLTWTNGTDVVMQSFTGMSIGYNEVGRYSSDTPIIVSGNQEWTVTISNVNGSADPDDDETDNSMSFNLNATSVDENKGILIEEATGTWCTWCPRGTVFMEEMAARFGDHFAGVAVHNGDPMVLSAYDNAITSFPGFTGFPSVVYQRDAILDPSAIVNPTISDLQDAPAAALEVGATLDGSTLTTSLGLSFLEDVDDNFSVLIVVTEDGVTGTGNGFNQINAYSGGGNGPMGGFELLPGSVPADFMVYDHVGRALIGGFDGVDDMIMGAFTTGDVAGHIFDDYNIGADMNPDNLHLIGILLDGSGDVVNAISTPIADALDNGLFTITSTQAVYDNTLAEIFPNPVTNYAMINITLPEASDVTISLVNSVGQQVAVNQYGSQFGEFQLEYDMSDLSAGIYFFHIQAGNKFFSQKITKTN
jgi:hypothetical protein